MRCRRCGFEGAILYEFVHLGWFWDGSHFSACPECGREHKINLPLLIPEFLRLIFWKQSHARTTIGGPRRVGRPELMKALDFFTLRHLEWEKGRLPRAFTPDDCRYNDALNEFFFFDSACKGEDVPRPAASSHSFLPETVYFPDSQPDSRCAAWKQSQVAERVAKTKDFLNDFKQDFSEPLEGSPDPDFRLFVPDMYPHYYQTLISSGENLDEPENRRETLRLKMVDLIFPKSEEDEREVRSTGLEMRQIHHAFARKIRRDWLQVWDEEE